MPIVSTFGRGPHDGGVLEVAHRGVLDGTSLGIDAGGPIGGSKGARGNKFALLPIDYVEKSILICLHHNTALAAANREIREHQGLRRVIVPVVSRRCLIVPDVFPIIGAKSKDGSGVEIITLATQFVVPGRCVSSTEINEVKFGIVDDRVPGASAASSLPPLA